jgi:hypothetical protein
MNNDRSETIPQITALYSRYSKSFRFASANALVFTLLVVFLLYTGWINRAEKIWTPEHGLGYYLGIVGGTLMLLLLLYPLRKRIKWMNNWLPVRYWFQTHMIFGVLGPVLILLHSSYNLGSLNGQVALFSMLTVAISGLFGRYIYVKIHYGLYGSKAAFEEIRTDSEFLNINMGMLFSLVPEAKTQLANYEEEILASVNHSVSGYFRRTRIRLKGNRLYKQISDQYKRRFRRVAVKQKLTKREYRHALTHNIRLLSMHKRVLLKLNDLNYYERLFSAWHILHLPLFIMMVITGLIHIYAVHVY